MEYGKIVRATLHAEHCEGAAGQTVIVDDAASVRVYGETDARNVCFRLMCMTAVGTHRKSRACLYIGSHGHSSAAVKGLPDSGRMSLTDLGTKGTIRGSESPRPSAQIHPVRRAIFHTDHVAEALARSCPSFNATIQALFRLDIQWAQAYSSSRATVGCRDLGRDTLLRGTGASVTRGIGDKKYDRNTRRSQRNQIVKRARSDYSIK